MIPGLDFREGPPEEPGWYIVANPFPWGGASYCLVEYYYNDRGRLDCSSAYAAHSPSRWDKDGDGLLTARIGTNFKATGDPLAAAMYTVNTAVTYLSSIGFKVGNAIDYVVEDETVCWGPFGRDADHLLARVGVEIETGKFPVVYVVVYDPDGETVYETEWSLGRVGGWSPLKLREIQ